ncbi:hypothetical protein F4859DRAFT_422497 [Xylaria cf. heliscus]|nr:hypothetical protein F4859DRAFT_422497 [Xylaria cf. heliscus]
MCGCYFNTVRVASALILAAWGVDWLGPYPWTWSLWGTMTYLTRSLGEFILVLRSDNRHLHYCVDGCFVFLGAIEC